MDENKYFWIPFHLKEAVGPCDAVEAEDRHVKESQTQPSISDRVLHVSHPALVQVVLNLMVIGQKPTQAILVEHTKSISILDHLPC